MLSPRLPSRALALLVGLAAGGCEIIADFDRDKINQSMVTTGDLPQIPVVPPEKPVPMDDGGAEDAGTDVDAGADAAVGDAGEGEMDSGPAADPLDAGADGGDASEPPTDAGADGGDAEVDSGP